MFSVVVWSAVEYNLQSCLLRNQENPNKLNIREVLEVQVLTLLQATPHSIFQKNIVQDFFEGRRVPLIPWAYRLSYMSGI